MRVLVCGDRDYNDQDRLFAVLDELHLSKTITDVVHGAARGADMLAHEWAYARNIRMWPCPADWKRHGRAAGPIRNQRMLDDHTIDLVVTFSGGRGTDDMVRRARRANIPVMEIAL